MTNSKSNNLDNKSSNLKIIQFYKFKLFIKCIWNEWIRVFLVLPNLFPTFPKIEIKILE